MQLSQLWRSQRWSSIEPFCSESCRLWHSGLPMRVSIAFPPRSQSCLLKTWFCFSAPISRVHIYPSERLSAAPSASWLAWWYLDCDIAGSWCLTGPSKDGKVHPLSLGAVRSFSWTPPRSTVPFLPPLLQPTAAVSKEPPFPSAVSFIGLLILERVRESVIRVSSYLSLCCVAVSSFG